MVKVPHTQAHGKEQELDGKLACGLRELACKLEYGQQVGGRVQVLVCRLGLGHGRQGLEYGKQEQVWGELCTLEEGDGKVQELGGKVQELDGKGQEKGGI